MSSKTISEKEELQQTRASVEEKLAEFEENVDLLSDKIDATTRSASQWLKLAKPLKWTLATLAACGVFYFSATKIFQKKPTP